MDSFRLVRPDGALAERVMREYRREILEADGGFEGSGSLRNTEDPAQWLFRLEARSRPETLPEGCVLSDQYLYVRESDGYIVGMICLRHYLDAYLEKFAGHIGYSIRPSQRRRGFGARMLGDCLAKARELGLRRVLITCRDDNEASRRTILACGGVYESTEYEPDDRENMERYWIEL